MPPWSVKKGSSPTQVWLKLDLPPMSGSDRLALHPIPSPTSSLPLPSTKPNSLQAKVVLAPTRPVSSACQPRPSAPVFNTPRRYSALNKAVACVIAESLLTAFNQVFPPWPWLRSWIIRCFRNCHSLGLGTSKAIDMCCSGLCFQLQKYPALPSDRSSG